ncbi:MAG TPA: PP2C family protein-serine/threonine phosphatase [Spirochaetota bacterium]|nr:PP2C family protein-serine/threonine phosphatase [Spirochaetota bacterium]HPU89430.1 PP2C family protein-serine/threonine phosphatase [Spirochaetota bacterium]
MAPDSIEYYSRDADYILREALTNMKGLIDFLYFGGLEECSEEENARFHVKLKESSDTLYSLLNSNIIEKANRIEKLNAIIRMDLELASKIQHKILPDNSGTIGGMDFHVSFIPMMQVGGDIYDIAEIRPGCVRIFLADATGHGVQTALITMIIKSEYEMLKNVIASPAELLVTLNDMFTRVYSGLGMFFTCIIVDVDVREKTMRYSSAGHPVQYLIRPSGEFVPLSHKGVLVGFREGYRYREDVMAVPDGGKLMLYSDGIYEEFNAVKDEYGEERLRSFLERCTHRDVRDMVEAVVDDLMGFIGGQELSDDITMIGVELPK